MNETSVHQRYCFLAVHTCGIGVGVSSEVALKRSIYYELGTVSDNFYQESLSLDVALQLLIKWNESRLGEISETKGDYSTLLDNRATIYFYFQSDQFQHRTEL